jgi:hypothetical protein
MIPLCAAAGIPRLREEAPLDPAIYAAALLRPPPRWQLSSRRARRPGRKLSVTAPEVGTRWTPSAPG